MIAYLRDIRTNNLDLNVEEGCTVGGLKQKIAEEKNVSPEGIRLIFNSKVLEDSALISSLSTSSSQRIVFYIPNTKPKPAAQPTPAAQMPTTEKTPTPAPAPATTQAPKPEPAQRIAATPQATGFPQAAGFKKSPLDAIIPSEDGINKLLEFGYERPVIEYLLKVCQNNTELAGSMLGEGYDTIEKIDQAFMAMQQQHQSQFGFSQQQALQLLEQVASNPQALESALRNNGVITILVNGVPKQVLINVQELAAYAIAKGYAQTSPDGQNILLTRGEPQLTPDEIQQLRHVDSFYKGLSQEQQTLVQRLSMDYSVDLPTVLQYYQACDCKEEETKSLLTSLK